MPMLSFRISEELAARVDEAAAGNRSAWIKQAIEERLSGPVQQESDSGPGSGGRAVVDRRTELLRRARF
jgi:metal-responsive CopG/Arc/MetJ family transcriptional regulator